MSAQAPDFREPSGVERIFNKAFGLFVGLGLAPSYNYLVQVRGRKTGRVYAAPVNLLEIGGRRFLVAPRGRTQWVRNAEAAGEVVLKRGSSRRRFRIRAVPNEQKPEILKTYLDRFKLAVQRYFPVPAGSDAGAFREIADRYPVFELLPPSEAPSAR
jgi:deazaflavin-dependent oxidoreductase (nitroreductase family)